MKCVGLALLMVVSTINGWPSDEGFEEGGLIRTAQSETYGDLEYGLGGDQYVDNSQIYDQEEASNQRQNSEVFQNTAFVSDNRGLNTQQASYVSRDAQNEEFRQLQSLNQEQIQVPSGGYQRNIQLDQIGGSADNGNYLENQSANLRVNVGDLLQASTDLQSSRIKREENSPLASVDQFLQHLAGLTSGDDSDITSSVDVKPIRRIDTEDVHRMAYATGNVVMGGQLVPSYVEKKRIRPTAYYNRNPMRRTRYQRPKTFANPLLRGGEKQNYGNEFINNEPETYVRETNRFAESQNIAPSQPRITVVRNNGFTEYEDARAFERNAKEYINEALKEAGEAKTYAKLLADRLSAYTKSVDKDLAKVKRDVNSQDFANPIEVGDQVKVVEVADNSNTANLGHDQTVQADYVPEIGNQNAPTFQRPYYFPYGKFNNNPRYRNYNPTVVTKPNYGPFLDYPVQVRKAFIPHRIGNNVPVVENADNTQNFANPNEGGDKVKVVETADHSESIANVNNDNADKVQVVENAVNNNYQDKVRVVEQAENPEINNSPGDESNNGVNVVNSPSNPPIAQGVWNQDNSHLLRYKPQNNKPVFLRPQRNFVNNPRFREFYPGAVTKPNYGPFLDYPVQVRKGFIPRRIGGGVNVVENADNTQNVAIPEAGEDKVKVVETADNSESTPSVNNNNADKVQVVENAVNNNDQDQVKVADLVINQDDLEKAKFVNNNPRDESNNGVNVEPSANNPSIQGIWNHHGLDNSHLLRDSIPVNENAPQFPSNGGNVPEFKRPSNYLPNGKFLNNPRYKDLYPTVVTNPNFSPNVNYPVQVREGIPDDNVNVHDGAPGFMTSPSNLNQDSEEPDTVQNAYNSRPKYNGYRPYRTHSNNYLRNGPIVRNSYYRNPPNFLPNQALNEPTTIVGGPGTGLQVPDISPVFAPLPDVIPSQGNNANLLRTDKNTPLSEDIVKPVEEKLPQEIVPTGVNGPIRSSEVPDISPAIADVIALPDGTYKPSHGNNAHLLRTDKNAPVEKNPQDSTSLDNTKTSVFETVENDKQDPNPASVEKADEIAKNNVPVNKVSNIEEPTTILGDGPKVTGFQRPDISPTLIDFTVQPDGTLTPSQENNDALTNDSQVPANEGSLENIIEKLTHGSSPKDVENKENGSSTNGLSPKSADEAPNDDSIKNLKETEGNESKPNLNDATSKENTSTLTKRSTQNNTGAPNDSKGKKMRNLIKEVDEYGNEINVEVEPTITIEENPSDPLLPLEDLTTRTSNENINTGTTDTINDISTNPGTANGLNENEEVEINNNDKPSGNPKISEAIVLGEDDKKGSKDTNRVKHKKGKRKHRKGDRRNKNAKDADSVNQVESTSNTEAAETQDDEPFKVNLLEDIKVSEDQTVSKDSDLEQTDVPGNKHTRKHSKATKIRKTKKKHSKRNKGKKIETEIVSDDENEKNNVNTKIESTDTEVKSSETLSEDNQSTGVKKDSKDKVKRKHEKRSKGEKTTSRRHKKDKKSKKHKKNQNINVNDNDQEETKAIINEESINQQDETPKKEDVIVAGSHAEEDSIIEVKDKNEKDRETVKSASVTTSDDKVESKNDDKSKTKDTEKKKPSDETAGETKGDENEVKSDEPSNTDDLKDNEYEKDLSESQIIRKITRYYKLQLPKRSTKPALSTAEKEESPDSSKNEEKSLSDSDNNSEHEEKVSTNLESVDEISNETKSKKHHLRLNAKHKKGKTTKNVEINGEIKSDNDNSESNLEVQENITRPKKSKHSKKHSKHEIDENLNENTEQIDNYDTTVSENSKSDVKEEENQSKKKESTESKAHEIESELIEEVQESSEKSEADEVISSTLESVDNSNESVEEKCADDK